MQGHWTEREEQLSDDDIRLFLQDMEANGGIVNENEYGRPPRRRANFSLRRLMAADPAFYGLQGSMRRRKFQKKFTYIRALTQDYYEAYRDHYLTNPVGNVQEG